MTAGGQGAGSVLVLAPLGRDAEVVRRTLAGSGLACRVCPCVRTLADEPLDEIAVLILTEEVLSPEALRLLRRRLDAQPAWSTLPVIAFPGRGGDGIAAWSEPAGGLFAGLVLLERPIRTESFVSIVRAAAATRQRQYQLRDELAARAAAEAHARMLAHEMKHRIKNSLALVGAMAAHTFRGEAAPGAGMARFTARLKALARAQDVLTGDGEVSADLDELVERALEPHRHGSGCQRFRIEGPRVRLPAPSATALAMALHELATNALKYGALSRETGEVLLHWQVEPAERGPELHLEWRERGGPPVTPPARRGFGSGLVERALAAQLRGRCAIAFERDGVVCDIRAPLPHAPAG